MKTPAAILAAASCSFAVLACASAPEPQIASPAPLSGYAEEYPAAVQSIMDDFNKEDEKARTIDIAVPRYPDELKNPKWAYVLEIDEAADRAGKSRAYVERVRETDGAKAFFDASKDEINKKVSGSVQYVAKQKGCSAEISGSATHALEEAVEKQMEERTREQNEAHRQIDRYREALGPENAAALEKQADDISRASYVVNIELVEEKIRLRALLEDAEEVKKTLDDAVAKERSFQAESGRTDADKKASADRIASMDKSRGLLSAAVTAGKDLDTRIETRIEAAKKRHEDAMTSLKDAIKKRGG